MLVAVVSVFVVIDDNNSSSPSSIVALLETGHNVEEYIPYIIAMADTNERYLPEALDRGAPGPGTAS